MSRVLAQLMGAAEPQFRAQLMRLEQAAGLPGADIRLTMEVIAETRDKIRELGLDPHDTTGPELYQALTARLLADETRLRDSMGLEPTAAPAEVLDAVRSQLTKLPVKTQAFTIKQSTVRALLKKLQPKATMKKLGYRSLDSMLKHEPAAQLLAATAMIESAEWQAKRLDAYRKLTGSDFETKKICFFTPTNKQWPQIAADYIAQFKHNQIVVPELGAVILLPLQQDLPALAITSFLLALGSINDLRSLGSYLKLEQVRSDFGSVYAHSIQQEPMTAAELAGELLPWKVVQWFYGRGHSAYYPDVFEPHVQPEDLSWHDAEGLLAGIHPALAFWEGSQLLALLDGTDTVSLNMLDVALSVCNGLSYGERMLHHMRDSLSRELMARYLHQDNLHALLTGKLNEQLIPSLEFASD